LEGAVLRRIPCNEKGDHHDLDTDSRRPGSVSGASDLPVGFTGTFTSAFVETGDVRQHVVIGGDGPPLLLIHGWPQSWYAWRHVMLSWPRPSRSSCPTSVASV
jgi:hypothetical protein